MLPYSVDGVLAATLPVVMLRTDRGDADLEEFRDIVDQGEDDDGDDEGSARVLSPETIEQIFFGRRWISPNQTVTNVVGDTDCVDIKTRVATSI